MRFKITKDIYVKNPNADPIIGSQYIVEKYTTLANGAGTWKYLCCVDSLTDAEMFAAQYKEAFTNPIELEIN